MKLWVGITDDDWFRFLTEEQSRDLGPELKARVADELADVLGYLVRLADRLDIDLIAAAHNKISRNAEKYPVEKSRGSARKYSDL